MSHLRVIILLLLSANASASPNLAFTEAYVAAAPPGATAMAAYMTVENPGTTARNITAISSTAFAEVQIHRSIIEKGVARMQPLEQLVVEPGSKLELKPGGIHLMLLEPARDFEPGDIIILELKEADGTQHSLGLKVHRMTTHSHPHHH